MKDKFNFNVLFIKPFFLHANNLKTNLPTSYIFVYKSTGNFDDKKL